MNARAPRASAVQTRDRLIAVAHDLFHARGYHAVGVQDLVNAAGIPKGSFYNHFASKQELAIAALERYAAQSPVPLLWTTPAGPRAGIRAHFEELERRFVAAGLSDGCMMGNFANELADHDDAVRELLNTQFTAWMDLIAAAIKQSEATEGLVPLMPADELAGVIVSLWEGSLTRARAAGSAQPIRQFFTTVFDQLLPATDGQKES